MDVEDEKRQAKVEELARRRRHAVRLRGAGPETAGKLVVAAGHGGQARVWLADCAGELEVARFGFREGVPRRIRPQAQSA
jgi:hypothetical protein